LDNSDDERLVDDFFQGKAIKEKHKLIIKTAILSSIISIIVFCMVSYHLYSYNRYRECLNNNAALWSFEEGRLELIEKDDDTSRKVYAGYGMRIQVNEIGEIDYISDENGTFVKTFKDNILQSVSIDDNLADFISYLNPKVWFGGVRTVQVNKEYQRRSDKEIDKLRQSIEEGGEDYLLSSGLEFMEFENQYIIIK